MAFQIKLPSQCVFQSYTVSVAIIWIYHNKVAIPAFLHFSVGFICFETHTKNKLPSELRKSVFRTEC